MRFIAKAFRVIVEGINWLALALLVFSIFVYIFNRNAALEYLGHYGIYADSMVVFYAVYLVVAYILVMGVLCVFLEIYSSLDQLVQSSSADRDTSAPSSRRLEPTV